MMRSWLPEYAGSRPPPLQNPLNDSTKAYVRMAVRSARNPSTDNLADLSECLPMCPGHACYCPSIYLFTSCYLHTLLVSKCRHRSCNKLFLSMQTHRACLSWWLAEIGLLGNQMMDVYLTSCILIGGKKDLGERRSSGDEHPTRELVRSRWQRWVAVRDAPYPGHIFRYPKLMLEYHYTGNRACLHPNKC